MNGTISTNLDLRMKLESEPDGAWVKATDIGLIVARGVWPRAEPKTSYIDIPGSDGKLDLSEVLRGEATFSNVTGTILFIVLNHDKFNLNRFVNHYHGRRVMIRMGDDDEHYRVGRCWVSADDRKRILREFTLTVDAEPYRYSLVEKSVEVPIIAAVHPEHVKVLEYTKYHTDPKNPYDYDKTKGDFVFNTTLYEDNPRGTLGISISPKTWYSFSWAHSHWKEPYCYLADGTEIKTPGHFYSGEYNELLCVDIGEDITGMVLMPISSGTEVINEGRKILTPRVYATAECTIAGNLSATVLENDQLVSTSYTQIWRFTGGNGKRKFYSVRTDEVQGNTYYCFDIGTEIYPSLLLMQMRIEINYTMQTFRVYMPNGEIVTETQSLWTAQTPPAGYTPLSDCATMESESGVGNESSPGFIEYDFQLGPGVNTVIAYADKAGGKAGFVYREGLL